MQRKPVRRLTLILIFLALGGVGHTEAPPGVEVVLQEGHQRPRVAWADYLDDKWLLVAFKKPYGEGVMAAFDLGSLEAKTHPYAGGTSRYSLPHPVVKSRNDKVVAFLSAPGKLSVWAPPHALSEFELSSGEPDTLVLSPDGRFLAVAETTGEAQGRITVWECESGRSVRSLEVPQARVEAMRIAPDSSLLAVALQPQVDIGLKPVRFQVHDLRKEGPPAVEVKESAQAFDFTPDSRRLVWIKGKKMEVRAVPGWKLLSEQLSPRASRWGDMLVTDQSRVLVKEHILHQLYELAQVKPIWWEQSIRESWISSDSKTVWTVGDDQQVGGFQQSDAAPEEPPRGWKCPLLFPESFHHYPRVWLGVCSPQTRQPVVGVVGLAIEEGELEWLIWTKRGDFVGSPEWRRFARMVVAKGEPHSDIGQVSAALGTPGRLLGRVGRPRSVALDRAGDAENMAYVRTLVEEVITKPSAWVQMCSMAKVKRRDTLPSPEFYRRDWTGVSITPEKFRQLRSYRQPVLDVLSSELRELTPDLVAATAEHARRLRGRIEDPELRADHSMTLETYLLILVDLNGVECLDELLEMEAAVDSHAIYRLSAEELSHGVHDYYPERYGEHALVLSTIVSILRAEGVNGLGELANYNAETREAIVRAARNYLRTTPKEKRKGAKAMKPSPIAR